MPGHAAAADQRQVAVPLDGAPDLLALASDPALEQPAVVSVRGWRVLVADPVAQLRSIAELDEFADVVGWRRSDVQPLPFGVCAVGFVGDDASPPLLALPPDHRPAVAALPAVHFGVYRWTVAVSPLGDAWVVGDPDAVASVRRWARAAARRPSATTPSAATAVGGLTRAAHARAVARILEWIAAGDLYQANLTFQVGVPWQGGVVALARRLWEATPDAAHAAMLSLDEGVGVASVSPETFLRSDGDVVTTRPIKGTRPRGRTRGDDRRLAAALRASTKDHAEHVMIVDLCRNDLGRVCEPGSVDVADYAALEAHPTVWHLASTVQGRLRDDVSLGDLLAAAFPPGSVTGTPKRMAVARTALLEPVRRGVYCGAIGVVTRGLVDLSVAIRTAVVSDGRASYGTGGAIVADSRADAEYDEALDKAAAFLTATRATL